MNAGGFFPLLGEVVASFAGLLFISLTLNLTKLTHHDSKHLMLLARQTFVNLLYMVSVSLMMVSVFAKVNAAGIYILVSSLAGLSTCLLAIREHERAVSEKRGSRKLNRSYYLPAVLYVALAWSSGRMIVQHVNTIPEIEIEMIVLLIISARNAWILLMP